MNSASTLRVGVIGTGTMGAANARIVHGLRDTTVTAVTSRTRANAERVAADLGPETLVFDDLRAMLAADAVDAVVVATPDHLHAEAVELAAAHGKHVLIEKPLATSLEDADRCVRAVREAGVVGMCLFNHRWVPAYAQTKELIGQIGAPVAAFARKDDTIFVPTTMLEWAERTTCAWFLSSHDIDLVTWLFDDEIESVYASARTGKLQGMGIDTPDAIQIQARFRGGAIATFESAWIYPNTFPTMVDSYVTVIGEEGAMQVDRQSEGVALATNDAFTYPRNMLQRTVHGRPAGAYVDAIEHWVSSAREGREPLISIESSRHVAAVLEAAHRSIATGTPEHVG